MSDLHKRISFNLDFLDRAPIGDEAAHLERTKYRYNWRNIAIILALIGFGIYLIVANDGPASSNGSSTQQFSGPLADQPSTAGDNSSLGSAPTDGQYRCSSSDSASADQLKSADSREAIDAAEQELTQRQDELRQLKREIDMSSATDNSTQMEIDDFNSKVSDYNLKLDALKSDEQTYEVRRTAFNASVEAYNSYLQSHCRAP